MSEASSDSSAARPFEAEKLIRLRRVGSLAASPCGTWLAVAVERLDEDESKYVSDLWRVPLDGGAPSQLTRGPFKDAAPGFRRDGDLGFLSNRPLGDKPAEGEEERRQVWVLPAAGGEPRPVTDEPLGVTAFQFAAAGDRLVCIAPVLPDVPLDEQRETLEKRRKHGPTGLRYSDQPVRYWDHWLPATAQHVIVFDETGKGRTDLTPEATLEHREAELDVSRDGARLAVTSRRLNEERLVDIGLLIIALEGLDAADSERDRAQAALEVARVELGELGEHHGAPRFSPDGRRLACWHHRFTRERAGRMTLRIFELADAGSGEVSSDEVVVRRPAADWDRWPTPAAFTPDGRRLVVTADDEASVPVFAVDLASDTVTRLTSAAAGGSHASVTVLADGETVVGVRSTLFHPPEVFALEANGPAGGSVPKRLTELSGFSEADGLALAERGALAVTSTDGERVECTLLTPTAGDDPFPALLWIHGGPMSAWADGWHWRWNPLVAVAAGYAVALPNPRGSTGFGQEWIEGIWGNVWGAQCFDDVMAVADALVEHDAVDGCRMAAMGGSFGGYMINWLGANTDRFGCLITHAAVSSMSVFYGDTDLPAFWALFMGEYPYDDPASFDRYSPSRRLDQWRTPTLIIHGERDYRVPISQALHLFEGLRFHDVDCELLVFPDENHWILRPRNITCWYEAVLEFLGRHLAGAGGG